MRGPGGRLFSLGLGLVLLGVASNAEASAWAMPKGQGQAIVKLEAIEASKAFDADGQSFDLLGGRRDGVVSLQVEYGLTDRLTLQAKGEYQSGRDGAQDFNGRGPIEIGARWQVYRDERNVVALYGGYSQSGDTRNAGYAEPGQGDHDTEIRLLAGRGGPRLFGEVQLARRWRDGLPDEMRLDVTAGWKIRPQWLLMGQAYLGRADARPDGGRSQWAVAEVSAVRHFGPWSGQAAWRATLAGTSTPVSYGPVLAIWRRF